VRESSAAEVAPKRHQGDLTDVLRSAAVDVILDKGLNSFSLREVARRAGVSHAAPGYHFGDVRGLLTSVAIEGFNTLYRETAAATDGCDDPIDQLKAIGRAYVRVGLQYPAHCEVIFRADAIDAEDARVQEAGLRAYAVLESTVAQIASRHNPALNVSDAARLCWSVVQGLVQLQATFIQIDSMCSVVSVEIEDRAERFTELLLSGLIPQGMGADS
jgi:AcrR family transcriptional regulator